MRDEGTSAAPDSNPPEPYRAMLALWFARPPGASNDGKEFAALQAAFLEVSASHIATVASVHGRLTEIATKLATARDHGALLAANVDMACCLTEAGSKNAKAWAEFVDRLHGCRMSLKDAAIKGGASPEGG
jgi:hypothetical protein